jgi:phosphoribosylaminoimidazolecarboxamide formyltransferase/IMP cyclohydrolase
MTDQELPDKKLAAKKPIRRALISVYDKSGLTELVQALDKAGVEIVSTGSTADTVVALGVQVTRVEELTGFPECFDGRVKTLHPHVHAGILADLQLKSHADQLAQLNVMPFDLVVVNLYPFQDTVSSGASFDQCIEKIDIGGPSMVRGAAKNFANVAVVTDRTDYPQIIRALEDGGLTRDQRLSLARRAFQHTAAYDVAVASWFNKQDRTITGMPEFEGAVYQKVGDLRYGENPHQPAALYADVAGHNTTPDYGTIVGTQILSASSEDGGKAMSYNNYLDAGAALRAAYDFAEPAVAIVKHNNPCGLAVGTSIADAYAKAFACDPVSAYGSVVAANQKVTLELAELVKPVFTEVIVAPDYAPEALELLLTKKNLRILQNQVPHQPNLFKTGLIEARKVTGGLLVQECDTLQVAGDQPQNWQLVAGQPAVPEVLADLEFIWRATRSVKSNAILIGKNGATVGIGMGQVNRLDACHLAVNRANTLGQGDNSGERARGAVAASDAFFPFADGLEILLSAGVTAVVCPGGSMRDQEVIDAAQRAGVTMYFTGTRHFNH